MSDYIPFVYWIQNKTTGMKYIGVKYAKGCSPEDLWTTYFTSSKSIHKLIQLYGKEDFKIKILHTFQTAEEAILKEAKYVSLAIKKEDYINFCHLVQDRCRQVKAGKLGGATQVKNKQGIHKQTKEERLVILATARKIQHNLGKNPMTHASKETQSERGKRGGVKNKGFKWYNNGSSDFKYTAREQNILDFDEFIQTTIKKAE